MLHDPRTAQFVLAEPRLAYSIAELAAKTATSVPFVRKEIRRGHLRASKVSRRVLITPNSVRDWLDGSATNEVIRSARNPSDMSTDLKPRIHREGKTA